MLWRVFYHTPWILVRACMLYRTERKECRAALERRIPDIWIRDTWGLKSETSRLDQFVLSAELGRMHCVPYYLQELCNFARLQCQVAGKRSNKFP